jgi:Lar family restriction alleviation protein
VLRKPREKLKPCPFCGGDGVIKECALSINADGILAWVSCKKCGASAGLQDTEKEAVSVWNDRVGE